MKSFLKLLQAKLGPICTRFWPIILFAIVFLFLCVGVTRFKSLLNAKIEQNQTQIEATQRRIEALEISNADLAKTIAEEHAQLIRLQVTNDAKVKEAARNAFRQNLNMPDSDVCDAFNKLVERARSYDAAE